MLLFQNSSVRILLLDLSCRKTKKSRRKNPIRGGMGEVYLAEDLTLDRKVALKFLPEAFTNDPERMARFEREAKLLASLNHPNIAGIHGLEQYDRGK